MMIWSELYFIWKELWAEVSQLWHFFDSSGPKYLLLYLLQLLLVFDGLGEVAFQLRHLSGSLGYLDLMVQRTALTHLTP